MELPAFITQLNPIGCSVVFVLGLYIHTVMTQPKARNLPPGPWALPIIGNPILLVTKLKDTFLSLRDVYGDLYSVYLGRTHVVILSDVAVVKDAMINFGDCLCRRSFDRIHQRPTRREFKEFSNRDAFRDLSKTTLTVLSDNKVTTNIITDNSRQFIDNIKGGGNIRKCTLNSMINCYITILFGKKCTINRIAEFDGLFERSFTNGCKYTTLCKFPLMSWLPCDVMRIKQSRRDMECIMTSLMEEMVKVVANKDNTYIHSFCDAFVKLAAHDAKEKNRRAYNADILSRILIEDFFIYHVQVTSAVLEWTLLYLAKHPDIQSKLQQEIQNVIGDSKTPTYNDINKVPLVEAFMLEVQRICSVVELSMPQFARGDVVFQDKLFAQGTVMVADVNTVHMDPEDWAEPEVFNPERFIDENGKIVGREKVVPLGYGTDMDGLEPLTKEILFIYTTTILQNYFIAAPDNATKDYLLGQQGGFMCPLNVPKCVELQFKAH